MKAQHANSETFDIENAWVFKTLNIPHNRVEENVIRQYHHLHGIAFQKVNIYDITLLIRTDHPGVNTTRILHRSKSKGPNSCKSKTRLCAYGEQSGK